MFYLEIGENRFSKAMTLGVMGSTDDFVAGFLLKYVLQTHQLSGKVFQGQNSFKESVDISIC